MTSRAVTNSRIRRPSSASRWPETLGLALLVGLATRPLPAQLAPSIPLVKGSATSIIRNASNDLLQVTVELHWATQTPQTGVVLGRAVDALVSPAAFTLPPGVTQTVRIRVNEPVAAGTVLRLVTTMTPLAPPPTDSSGTGVATRLVLVTRFVGKVIAQ